MDKDIHSLKARELEVVLKISQAVSCTLDLKEILKMACQMTAQALNADRCSIGLLDTNGTYTITHSTYRRVSSYPSTAGEKFIVTHYPVIARKLRERKVIQIVQDQPVSFLSSGERKLLKQLHMKVFLAVPIMVEKKPLGAFHLARVEKSLPFSSSDISLCQTIANQIGIAIKNATLVKELKENHQLLERRSEDLRIRYQQQNLVLDISKSLFQSSNLQEVFNIITRKTCEALGLDRCTILQFDSEQKEAVIRSVFHSSGEPSGKGTHDSADLGKKFQVNSFPQVLELLLKKGFLLTEDINSNPLLPRTRKYIKDLGAKSTLTIPFYSGKKISGSLQLSTLKDHHHFTDSEIKFCQTIANLASMALQNVKLMQNLQEKSVTLQQQAKVLGKQYQEQTILLEISKALSQTLELKKLFEIVTQKTVGLLGVDRAVAMIIDQNTGDHSLFVHYSRVKDIPELSDFPKNVSEFPYLIGHSRSGQVYSIDDTEKSSISLREKKYFRKRKIKSVLVIPFFLKGKLLGILALNNIREKHAFTKSEIRLTQAIANQLSIAVENANLIEISKKHSAELEKLSLQVIDAQEEEKKNLAGKLHDIIAQDLTALQLDLKMSQQELPEQCAQIRNRLEEGEQLARQALENVRNLTMDLRPPILDDFGLASAIRWYVDGFSRRTNIKVFLRLQGRDCKLPPEFETSIYRAIQECLTNVAKHSKASQVSVSLDKKNEHLRIIIQDNGIGLDPEIFHFTNGFGLFRLKEETELLGGKYRISSKKGKGTRVVIIFPCKDKEKK